MQLTTGKPAPPTNDPGWRVIDATMRRHGYSGHALIESLHSAQECFGYLDETALRFIAGSLRVPLSKVYGVATFYHFFTLAPPARHECVVCMGTACYIYDASRQLEAVVREFGIHPGERTEDGELSLSVARCVGTCGLAPLVIIDGQTRGKLEPGEAARQLCRLVHHDT
jgi:bidirectional [NiFe] hydrogenase diaphorase subunit